MKEYKLNVKGSVSENYGSEEYAEALDLYNESEYEEIADIINGVNETASVFEYDELVNEDEDEILWEDDDNLLVYHNGQPEPSFTLFGKIYKKFYITISHPDHESWGMDSREYNSLESAMEDARDFASNGSGNSFTEDWIRGTLTVEDESGNELWGRKIRTIDDKSELEYWESE